jgi:hypothetical protein
MKQVLFSLLIAVIGLSACSPSTKLINSWTDKEHTPNSYENIGVTVLFKDPSNRYITEHSIVDQLKEKGLNGMPTVDVFPMAGRLNEITKVMDDSEVIKKKVIEKVAEHNIDALMIITMFDKTKEERWVNERNYMMGGTGFYGTPYGMRGGYYYDYYAYSLGSIYNDGYYVDDVTYFIECNLYDIKSEKLVWRAQTKSKNIQSVEEESKALAYIVAKELLSKKVVGK